MGSCNGNGACLTLVDGRVFGRKFDCSFRCKPWKCPACIDVVGPKWYFVSTGGECMDCSSVGMMGTVGTMKLLVQQHQTRRIVTSSRNDRICAWCKKHIIATGRRPISHVHCAGRYRTGYRKFHKKCWVEMRDDHRRIKDINDDRKPSMPLQPLTTKHMDHKIHMLTMFTNVLVPQSQWLSAK